LVASGRTVVDVAASLGITQSCLYRWKQQDLVDRGLKQGQSTTESTQLAAAQQRIRDLEEEVKILRKAAAAVEAVVPPKVRFRLVAELHDDGVRVTRACHALGVSKSGYYEWRHRAPSKRAIRHAWLTDLIGQIHQASRGTYGQPRVHAELVLGHGITVLLRGPGRLQPPRGGLGHRLTPAGRPGHQRPRDGHRLTRRGGRPDHPRGPRNAGRIQVVVATPRSGGGAMGYGPKQKAARLYRGQIPSPAPPLRNRLAGAPRLRTQPLPAARVASLLTPENQVKTTLEQRYEQFLTAT
jgi:transposase-like protein